MRQTRIKGIYFLNRLFRRVVKFVSILQQFIIQSKELTIIGKRRVSNNPDFKRTIPFSILSFLCLLSLQSFAQLDNKHWLPPLTGATLSTATFSTQNIVLSTPENTAFLVEIKTPDGTVVGSSMISSSSSYTYDPGDNDNNITLMSHTNVGVALTTGTSGLIFESPGGQDFYVNHRVNPSFDQAALLTNNKEKKVSPLRDYPYPKEEGIAENLSDHTVGTDYNDFIPVTFKNLKDFNYAV